MKIFEIIDKKWWFFAPFIAIIVYGIVMLLGHTQPIWFDEGYSILLAKSSFADLFALTAVDAHPPLFYALLKVWGSVFGFSEFALRSFSAVTMGAAIMLAASLIRRLFSTRVALIALPFIVFAPFLLRYGYEVRMYALATLIGVAGTYALVNAKKTASTWWWGLYAVLVAAGMYTLYLTVAVWLAHFVWLLVTSLRTDKTPFWKWKWLYAFGGAVLLFAVYIPTFLHQLLYSALPGMGSPVTATKLVDVASSLTLYTNEWAVGGWLSLLLIAVVVAVALFAVQAFKSLSKQDRETYSLLVFLAVIPLAFFALTSLPPRDPIFINRYMAHVSIFIYLLIGVSMALVWQNRGKLKSTLLAGKVGLSIATIAVLAGFTYGVVSLSSQGNFNVERQQKPMTYDVRNVAGCNDADTTIVARDPYTYIDSAYYFEGCDLKFYSEKNIEYKGGYAMLHDSVQRIGTEDDLTTNKIVVLTWVGDDESFEPNKNYTLSETFTFDKQKVEVYQRTNAE